MKQRHRDALINELTKDSCYRALRRHLEAARHEELVCERVEQREIERAKKSGLHVNAWPEDTRIRHFSDKHFQAIDRSGEANERLNVYIRRHYPDAARVLGLKRKVSRRRKKKKA